MRTPTRLAPLDAICCTQAGLYCMVHCDNIVPTFFLSPISKHNTCISLLLFCILVYWRNCSQWKRYPCWWCTAGPGLCGSSTRSYPCSRTRQVTSRSRSSVRRFLATATRRPLTNLVTSSKHDVTSRFVFRVRISGGHTFVLCAMSVIQKAVIYLTF